MLLLKAIVSTALHGVAFLGLLRSDFPSEWALEGLFLAGVSLSLALGLSLKKQHSLTGATTAMVIARVVVVWLLVYPEGSRQAVRLPLYCDMVFQLVMNLPIPYNKLASVGVAVALPFLPNVASAWNAQLEGHLTYTHLTTAIVESIVLLCSDRLRRLAEAMTIQRDQLRRSEDSIKNLIHANVDFQQYAEFVGERSSANERNRITRDLHDVVGYTLTTAMMMLEEALVGLRNGGDAPDLLGLIDRTKGQIEAGYLETRRVLRSLRDVNNADRDFFETVRQVTSGFGNVTGIETNVECVGIAINCRYTSEITDFVYKMVQEGLANSFRHGNASKIRVLFQQTETQLIVTIDDNGAGSEVVKEGIGLAGMRERADALGGSLVARNGPDGFSICARIPFEEVEL